MFITNLRAKTALGLPQNSFKPLSILDCDMYKAASRPGT